MPEALLDFDRRCRKGLVRRRRRQDDHVDIGNGDAGVGHCGAGGLLAKVGRRLALGHDVALADAGALHDPFVVGLDYPLEVGVLHDAGGQIRAASGDDGSYHLIFPTTFRLTAGLIQTFWFSVLATRLPPKNVRSLFIFSIMLFEAMS